MAGRAASLGGAVLYSHTDAAVPLRIGRRMQDAPHAWADGEGGLPCDKKCIGVLGWSWHCEYRVFGTRACGPDWQSAVIVMGTALQVLALASVSSLAEQLPAAWPSEPLH